MASQPAAEAAANASAGSVVEAFVAERITVAMSGQYYKLGVGKGSSNHPTNKLIRDVGSDVLSRYGSVALTGWARVICARMLAVNIRFYDPGTKTYKTAGSQKTIATMLRGQQKKLEKLKKSPRQKSPTTVTDVPGGPPMNEEDAADVRDVLCDEGDPIGNERVDDIACSGNEAIPTAVVCLQNMTLVHQEQIRQYQRQLFNIGADQHKTREKIAWHEGKIQSNNREIMEYGLH